MSKKLFNILMTLMLGVMALGGSSCLRDGMEECPPLKVRIVVKDRNYFNVDATQLEERKADDLPFAEYVPNICWVMRNAETGETVDYKRLHDVDPEVDEVVLDFPEDLPFGKYEITVWGGFRNGSTLEERSEYLDLHKGEVEGDDVYLAHAIIDYNFNSGTHTLEMQRTKGKLIVQKENFPEWVASDWKRMTGLYGRVTNGFGYSGEARLHVKNALEYSDNIVTKHLAAPTPGKIGKLNIDLFDAAGMKRYSTEEVTIPIMRNSLTVVRYVYDPTTDECKIYILINDTWEIVNQMVVD